jgi:hypothetical protein
MCPAVGGSQFEEGCAEKRTSQGTLVHSTVLKALLTFCTLLMPAYYETFAKWSVLPKFPDKNRDRQGGRKS